MVVNIYNDTIGALEQFLSSRAPELCPAEEDHMMWIGDFNRHHPLWAEDHNNHLFTAAALEASGKLLDLVADCGMIQALHKDILTLQSSSTWNWTHPDNVFCMEHTSQLLVL